MNTDHWRILIAVAAAVLWSVIKFGPGAWHFSRNALTKLVPKLQQGTTILSAWPLLVAAVALGPMIVPDRAPVPPVEPARELDLLDRCSASGRSLLADALDDIAAGSFESTNAKEDAINQKILDIIDAAFEPLNVEIAKAVNANRLTDCADKIRKGVIHE